MIYLFVNLYILHVCRNTSSSELVLYVYIYSTKNKAFGFLYLVYMDKLSLTNRISGKTFRHNSLPVKGLVRFEGFFTHFN